MDMNNLVEKFVSESGEEHVIALKCDINNRTFIITTDKKIFEKNKDGEYRECTENDKETVFLRKYTAPPRSLDIEM